MIGPVASALLALTILLPWQATAAEPYRGPMKFTYVHTGGNCSTCVWILAEGTITPTTDRTFAGFLKRTSAYTEGTQLTVELHSPGGDLQAAVRLGRMIRDMDWDTQVGYHLPGLKGDTDKNGIPMGEIEQDPKAKPSRCMSACAYAFLGGVARDVLDRAKLGVHQFDDPRNSASTAQLLQGALAQYVREMGADPALVYQAAASTPSQARDLYILERKQMEAWSVVTNFRDDRGWTIRPEQSGVVAEVHGTGRTKSSVSIHCRADGTRHLAYQWTPRLFGDYRKKPEDLAAALSHGSTFQARVDGHEIAGQELVKEPRSVLITSSGQFRVTAPLALDAVETIKRGAEISIQFDTARALYGWAPEDGFTTMNAGPNLDIAMKNCVGG